MDVSWALVAKIGVVLLGLAALGAIMANKATRDRLSVVGVGLLEALLERWLRSLSEPTQISLAVKREARQVAQTRRVMAQVQTERAARRNAQCGGTKR
jgi:hypothetical protein